MPFVLIRGTFEPTSGEPDGDSVRFQAKDDELFDKLEGRIEFKSGGQVQLRYEGIDALEKAAIQPFSSNATKRNIELLGGKRSGLPGYVLSSHADGNGRPVCFVFTGDPPDWDNSGRGDELQADLLRQSVNYRLLQEGHVYPMFYETLYKELRDEMVAATEEARSANREIWSVDRSTKGFQVDIPPDLSELPLSFLNFGGGCKRFINVDLTAIKELRYLFESYREEKIGFLPLLISVQLSFPPRWR